MNRAKLLRYEHGKTAGEVAEGANLALGTLRRVEAGEEPSAPVAKALADFYGVSVADLLGMKDAA